MADTKLNNAGDNMIAGGCSGRLCNPPDAKLHGAGIQSCNTGSCNCGTTAAISSQRKPAKIAMFVDEDGYSAPLDSAGNLALYIYDEKEWRCTKRISFGTVEKMNLPEIRARVHGMISEIDDCKVFIAKNTKGIFFSFLDGAGISIWQLEGYPADFLDDIMEKEKINSQDGSSTEPAIVAVGDDPDGIYKIDLISILKSNRSLTSKQALLPFLQKNIFSRLEVICEHVPKWFDREFDSLKLTLEVEESEDGLCRAIISPET